MLGGDVFGIDCNGIEPPIRLRLDVDVGTLVNGYVACRV